MFEAAQKAFAVTLAVVAALLVAVFLPEAILFAYRKGVKWWQAPTPAPATKKTSPEAVDPDEVIPPPTRPRMRARRAAPRAAPVA